MNLNKAVEETNKLYPLTYNHERESIKKGITLLKEFLPQATEIIIPNTLTQMLLKTDNPSSIENLNLPYPVIYLKMVLGEEYENKTIYTSNLLLVQTKEQIYMASLITNPLTNTLLPWFGVLKPVAGLEKFTINLLQLINHPEIQTTTTRSYSKEQIQKRFKRQQYGVGTAYIHLYPELKNHLSLMESRGNPYTAHWVRGHWVHFKHDRYKEARNTQKWIYPYIKGVGEPLKKHYVVKK